jgi:hypothetical protein
MSMPRSTPGLRSANAMDDCVVRIEKLENGYEVEIRDQKQVGKNREGGLNSPYKDPWCGYAFKTTAEVCAFLEKNLDKAVPGDTFSTSFDAAVDEDEGED